MKYFLLGVGLLAAHACAQTGALAEPQLVVARVEKMARVPQPLHIMDWKKTARDY